MRFIKLSNIVSEVNADIKGYKYELFKINRIYHIELLIDENIFSFALFKTKTIKGI